MDILTVPIGFLSYKLGFIRTENRTTDLLAYRKLQGFGSTGQKHPCRQILLSNLALSPEVFSGCLNCSKLFAFHLGHHENSFFLTSSMKACFLPALSAICHQSATSSQLLSPLVIPTWGLLILSTAWWPRSMLYSYLAIARTRQTGKFPLPAPSPWSTSYNRLQTEKEIEANHHSLLQWIQNNMMVGLLYFPMLQHWNQMQ